MRSIQDYNSYFILSAACAIVYMMYYVDSLLPNELR